MASVTEINSVANSLVYLEASLVQNFALSNTELFHLLCSNYRISIFAFALRPFFSALPGKTDNELTMLRPVLRGVIGRRFVTRLISPCIGSQRLATRKLAKERTRNCKKTLIFMDLNIGDPSRNLHPIGKSVDLRLSNPPKRHVRKTKT